MKRNKTFFKRSLLASAMFLSANVSAITITQEGDAIVFDSLENNSYQLNVKLPNGETKAFKVENGEFLLTPQLLGVKSLNNGQYKYELTPIFKPDSVSLDVRNLGDKDLANEYSKSFSQQAQSFSGVFTLNQDKLIRDNLETINKDSVVNDSDGDTRDQVFLDDLIVNGSICAGQDCVNGESFGFDTLRLKENNLRIKFQDTSASASFPTNDWQITANDSSNGGQNKFSIDDIDGGRTPFTIEARAPSHSLYVDDGGRIGMGTSTPVVEAHIVNGDSPTLRLEQNGSSGFTPQTWDVAGNEANFFVRDVTNGSRLPFKIKPSAPTNSLYVNTNGDIGLMTASPDASMHIRRTDSSAKLLVEDTGTAFNVQVELNKAGTPRVRFDNTSTASAGVWDMGLNANDEFIIRDITGGSNVLTLAANGNLTITGGLISTEGGGACTVADPCDRVFDKAIYKIPSIEDHAQSMWENMYLPAVGPTKPDQPVNMTTKMLRMLNELEKAHVYIEQLNNRLASLESKLESENN